MKDTEGFAFLVEQSLLWRFMMGKRSIGILLFILMFLFVGCDDANKVYTNEINDAWVNVDHNWIDTEDSYLGYLGSPNFDLDLSYRINPLDSDTRVMGYIEKYTYSSGVLIGTYTSHENPDLSEYAIKITFSYSAPTLQVVVVADGVLGSKTLSLLPD